MADEAPAAAVNPLDEQYASLRAALRLVPRGDPAFAVLETYCANTLWYSDIQLQNVWSVDGEKDGAAFAAHAGLPNHKLLWHGTNVAVVAAILKDGLRIMPHSGAPPPPPPSPPSPAKGSTGLPSPFLPPVLLFQCHVIQQQFCLRVLMTSARTQHNATQCKLFTFTFTTRGRGRVPRGKAHEETCALTKSVASTFTVTLVDVPGGMQLPMLHLGFQLSMWQTKRAGNREAEAGSSASGPVSRCPYCLSTRS